MKDKGWIKKENIKWLVLFFILAFGLRVFLSVMYTPVEGNITDQYDYVYRISDVLSGKISIYTRASTLIMTPIALLFILMGFTPLVGTIIAGCLISALTIIPLWMIAEHLNIRPEIASFFYIFMGLDLVNVLGIGCYNTELGILALTIYVLLMLKSYYKLAPLVALPQILTHEITLFLFNFLMIFIAIFTMIKNRKIINDDLRKYFWSFGLIFFFSFIKLVVLSPWWLANPDSLVSLEAQDTIKHVIFPHLTFYIEAAGSYILILFLFGFNEFYKKNKNSVLLQSWLYLPWLIAILPLFTHLDIPVRIASYSATGIAIVAAYAFINFKQKHWLMKIILVLLVIGNIIFVIKAAHFQFYTHSVGYLAGK